jgi:hypothetical protein
MSRALLYFLTRPHAVDSDNFAFALGAVIKGTKINHSETHHSYHVNVRCYTSPASEFRSVPLAATVSCTQLQITM